MNNLSVAKTFSSKKKVKKVKVGLTRAQKELKKLIEDGGYKVQTGKRCGALPVDLYLKSHRIGIIVAPEPLMMNLRGTVTPGYTTLIFSDSEVINQFLWVITEVKNHIRRHEMGM